MKILLPFRKFGGLGIDSPNITGGTERFAHLLWKHYPADVRVVEYDNDDVENRRVPMIVAKAAHEIGSDIIVANQFSTALTSSLQDRVRNVPILCFAHLLSDSMSVEAVLKKMETFYGNGGSLGMVSPFQHRNWVKFSTRRNLFLPPLAGYIKPTFCIEPQDVVPIKDRLWDFTTIGRCEKYKDPFSIHKRNMSIRKKGLGNYKSLVISNTANAEKDYHEASMLKYGRETAHFTPTHFNDPYAYNMCMLGRSRVCVSTLNAESYSITVLEAYERGVPVIAYTKEEPAHACQAILSTNEFLRFTRKCNPDEEFVQRLESLLALTDSDLQRLSALARQENSKEIWVKMLTSAFDNAITHFKACRKTSLSFSE